LWHSKKNCRWHRTGTETTSACCAVLHQLRGIPPLGTEDCFPVTGVVSGATAAGLLQCSVGWHSIAPCTALAIGDERGRTAHLRVIKVRSHHAAPTPITLLKVPWRIDYKLAVLVYKCLHGMAPSYLADELHHPAESEFRRLLCSDSTYGDRAFPVATVRNSLPQHITFAPSLPVFCCRLKTYFFELCYL